MKMNTYTGHQFDPGQMQCSDIHLEDIAHALSMLCRGCGHIEWFYTVGQHSINCAKEAKARGYDAYVQLACLLHDASEAYLSDIIRPMKLFLLEYASLEKRIETLIFERFGLQAMSEELYPIWRQIDDDMLDNELKVMMRGEKQRQPVSLDSKPCFEECPRQKVECEFLALATELIKETQKECNV